MWLHQLARLLKPLGGTIKENLSHSPHFSPSSPICASLPSLYYMRYETSLIHLISPLIRSGGSAKAEAKIRQYRSSLCRSGRNKRAVGAAVNSHFPGIGLDERCVAAKKYSGYIAAAAWVEKTAQIHINGFDWSTGRNPSEDSLSEMSTCVCVCVYVWGLGLVKWFV